MQFNQLFKLSTGFYRNFSIKIEAFFYLVARAAETLFSCYPEVFYPDNQFYSRITQQSIAPMIAIYFSFASAGLNQKDVIIDILPFNK